MQRSHRRWAVVLILAGLPMAAACTHKTEAPAEVKPAKLERIQWSDLSKVTLSPKAAERLDIKTAALRDEQVKSRKPPAASEATKATTASTGAKDRVDMAQSATRRVVPTSAVLYDAKGKTWVYTNPEPLVFVRHAVSIEYIDGDRAVLLDGPASGTAVVTVGAAELLGTEYGRK